MSKVATMLVRAGNKRIEVGEELPDRVVKALGEDHPAVGQSTKKRKKADDEGGNADKKKKKKGNK